MTNEVKAKEIANDETLYGEDPDENSKIKECYIAAMAMADFKDNQPISELDGWHTEPPTEDCIVLLLIQSSNICIWEVATWNNDKRYFQSLHSNFITIWTKWKLI